MPCPYVFEAIEIAEDDYILRYSPPAYSMDIAELSLQFFESICALRAVSLLEIEMKKFLKRYPVPLMGMILTEDDTRISISNDADHDFVFGWVERNTGEIILSFEKNNFNKQIQRGSKNAQYDKIYYDIPFRTKAEVRNYAEKSAALKKKQNLFLKALFSMWTLVSLAIILFMYFAPQIVGFAALFFSIWKSIRTYMIAMGKLPKTKKEQEDQSRKQRIAHVLHHVDRNPAGFERLKVENFKKDEVEQFKQRYNELRKRRASE